MGGEFAEGYHFLEKYGIVVRSVIEIDALAETVVKVGDLGVAAEPALKDAAAPEDSDVAGSVDDALHDGAVAGEVISNVSAALLQGDEVPQPGAGSLIHRLERDLQYPLSERNIQVGGHLAFGDYLSLEFDPRTKKLRRRGNYTQPFDFLAASKWKDLLRIKIR